MTTEGMKISIITATWNSGATVGDTLESVLRQSYPDIELIVVDGGSTDTTLSIVSSYEPRFGGRLRWISEPDRGIYDAMNKGIALATGDVVGILNSDDFYTAPDVLEIVANLLCDTHLEAVYGDIHYVDASDLTRCVRYYSSRRFRPWKMRLGYMPAHPSFYCRREVYHRLGGFDTTFKVAADFEQLLRFIYKGQIVTQYVAKDFVTMRTGGASTSGLASYRRIWADHRRAYAKNGIRSNSLLESIRYVDKAMCLIGFKLCEIFRRIQPVWAKVST